jgi:phosphopantothenoylcysteine decarboxylase/phosphopantothenate--cysteine ligase
LFIAPAMNRQMWQNAATQRNIEQLRHDNIRLLGPDTGSQACGEIGDGRMLEPQSLLAELIAQFGPHSEHPLAANTPNIRGVLQGKQLLITAGPTFEPIDPVRGITNRSSGKMGFAIAQAAADAGAAVTLISGPVHLTTPTGIHRVDVTTAQEMHEAVKAALLDLPRDCFIGVAAVADWRPSTVADTKIKKDSGATLTEIDWIENPDILASVAQQPNPPYCVGFAAESGSLNELEKLLPEKRARKSVPLLVGNIGETTFGEDTNQIMLCDENGTELLPTDSKSNLARILIFRIAQRLCNH